MSIFSQFASFLGFRTQRHAEVELPRNDGDGVSKTTDIQLSVHVWRHIFTFLPSEPLSQCRAVCNTWRAVIAEPQFSEKIVICSLRAKAAKAIESPKWQEKEIGTNLIEIAKLEAHLDPKIALQTIARLQNFMRSQGFFATQANDYITIPLLVEIAKIQVNYDPENAIETVKAIEPLSLAPVRDCEFDANAFVEEIHNGIADELLLPFLRRDYGRIPRYIHFFVTRARYQIGYDLSEARKSLENAEMIINALDANPEFIEELAEEFSHLCGIEEQISQDRAALTKMRMICETTENVTVDTLKFAIDPNAS